MNRPQDIMAIPANCESVSFAAWQLLNKARQSPVFDLTAVYIRMGHIGRYALFFLLRSVGVNYFSYLCTIL